MTDRKFNPFWNDIFTKNRKDDKHPVYFLKKIPLFSSCSNKELKKVFLILHKREYATGECLFKKGHPGAAMYIISDGEVSIHIESDSGKEIELAKLESGTFTGELALLDDSPRSASATAKSQTKAYAFFRSDLDRLIDAEPEIGSKILKELATIIGTRLKATNDQLLQAQNKMEEK